MSSRSAVRSSAFSDATNVPSLWRTNGDRRSRHGGCLLEREVRRFARQPSRSAGGVLGEGTVAGAVHVIARHELRHGRTDGLHRSRHTPTRVERLGPATALIVSTTSVVAAGAPRAALPLGRATVPADVRREPKSGRVLMGSLWRAGNPTESPRSRRKERVTARTSLAHMRSRAPSCVYPSCELARVGRNQLATLVGAATKRGPASRPLQERPG